MMHKSGSRLRPGERALDRLARSTLPLVLEPAAGEARQGLASDEGWPEEALPESRPDAREER